MKPRHSSSRLLLAALACTPFYVSAQTDLTPEQVADIVNRNLQPLIAEQAIPGMAVALVYNGKTQFFNYGVADKKTQRPVTENTLFELGSISKTFTGIAGSYALQSGTINLNDPAKDYAPELKGSQWENITLGQLATYTAGGLPLQLPDTVTDWPSLWHFYQQWQPQWAPGKERLYSNASIGLFGALMVKRSGLTFEQYLEKNVFQPLQLTSTFFSPPQKKQADYAWGYFKDKPVHVSPGMLAAEAYGLKSTAADMATYMRANINPAALTSASATLKQAILTSQAHYYKVGEMYQGLGWESYRWPADAERLVTDSDVKKALKSHPAQAITPPAPAQPASWVHKTGSTNGFGGYIAFIPEQKVGIVMLANKSYPLPLRVKAAYQILQELNGK